MRIVVCLVLAAIALAGPAQAKGNDDDKHGGGYERGFDRHDDRHDNRRFDRRRGREGHEFEERRRWEFERGQYGYARPPEYYPSPGRFYAPPVYAPPGLNLFVPFR